MTDQLDQTTPTTTADTVTVEVPAIEGNQVQDTEPKWYNVLPDDLKNNKNITKFNTLEDFASWQSNASKLIGKKVQDLSPDEIKQFLTPEELIQAAEARGLPKSVEEYELPSLASYEDPSIVLKLKELALAEGVTPKQMESLINYNREVSQELQARQKEAWTNELLATFGSKTGEEMELASQAARHYCSPALMQQLDAAGMGHNPEVVKAFAKVAREMLPDHIPRSSGSSEDHAKNADALAKEKLKDPEFYLRWKSGDKAARDELNKIYQ